MGEWSFLAAGGVMGELIAGLDWDQTPLGPIAGWPGHLRTGVGIMLESRHPMLIWWGPEFTMLYNDAFMELAGTKHPGGLGRSGREMFADIWETIGPMLSGVLHTGTATWVDDQLLMMNRRGREEETYWTYSYSPIRDAGGRVGGVFTATTDTTARVLGERRLRILRELGDISAVTAATVVEACAAAMEVLQRSRTDIPFAAVYLVDDDRRTAVRAASSGTVDDLAVGPTVLDRERAPDHPIWAVLDDGGAPMLTGPDLDHPGLFTVCGTPLGDAQPDTAVAVPLAGAGAESPIGVLFAGVSPYQVLDADYQRFLDLLAGQVTTALADAQAYQTQRRRADELTELDRAKTEFFTGISHELRTPLTLITGPAEDSLADGTEPLSPAQRGRLELISRNGRRLQRLVDTLLEFARLEGGALVPDRVAVDLAALTRGIGESFAPAVSRAGLGFTIDCPDLGSAVTVDTAMWEKIVLNLLSNAVKFTLAGGISLRLRVGADGVELAVADTGIGIAAVEIPLLFGRFHRVRGSAGRSHEGSGIGLALVAELAGLHGGAVTASSTPGIGSVFTVTLPPTALTHSAPVGGSGASSLVGSYREEAQLWSETALPPDGEVADPRPVRGDTGTPATILVAEDNADLRRFLHGLLHPRYRVVVVSDGAVALEQARSVRPDLVLTDVMMPGLDGFELLATLRADPATATIPVVLLSARAGPEAIAKGLAAGADDYLVKPFSTPDLLARVASNLAMARLRSRESAWRAGLLNALQDGFFLINPAGEVVEINDAFHAMLGYGPDGLPYPPPHPWWPSPTEDPDGYAHITECFAAVQQSGHGRYLLSLRHRDGHRLWADCSADSVPGPDGDETMLIGVARDVTAAHRAEQRDRLLAEAGLLLDRPAELGERLTALAGAAVAVLADRVVVSLAGPDGRFTAVAAVHRNGPEVAGVAPTPHRIPDKLLPDYQAGRAFVLGGVPDELLVEAAAPTAASSLIVPLVVHGRLLGSLAFVSTAGARELDGFDVALAEELGRRVAVVVEADRVATREQQLHAGTVALAAAATLTEAAAALSTAVVAALGASGAAVYATGSDDPHLHLTHITGYPPEIAKTFDHIRIDADLPVADAARARTAVWLGDRQAWLDRYPQMAVVGAADAAHGVIALPLTMADKAVGVLAASFPTARTFPPDERRFALTLVALAAQAFERAALSDAHWRIAQTLQRGLLPARLPIHPRLALAAHYLPAGQHTQAGGDWYDVIPLDEERVAIVVGDVVGSGPAAAVIMGQLRSALAGFLLESHAPAHALQWLSRLAQRIDGALGSTAVCLVLHTGTGELRWACAGHPPPLVLDHPGSDHPTSGTARYLDAHGVVLGFPGALPYTEGYDVLAPGASVLLYTDGLVERRGEAIDDGLDRLAAGAAAHLRTAPDALVPAMIEIGLGDAGPTDDVALIVARLLPGPLQQCLPATATQLSAVRGRVAGWAALAGLPDMLVEDLQLALGEAVANSVEHAYLGGPPGEFTYRLDRSADGSIEVEVRDGGTWRPVPADPGHRGRGLRMINVLADDVVMDTTGPGTTIRFVLPGLPVDPATGAAGPRAATGWTESSVELRAERRPEGGLILHLGGDLDLSTIDLRRAELFDRVRDNPDVITVDTSDVTYLASAGVGLLLETVLIAPDRIRLRVRPGSATARVLALTGLDRVVPTT